MKTKQCTMCNSSDDLEEIPILILVDGFEVYNKKLLLCEECQFEIEGNIETAMEMIEGVY